jgi:hypothetical protein
MGILQEYLNPVYLDPKYIKVLQETVKSRPIAKYLVLDNFLKEEVLDAIIQEQRSLSFQTDLHTSDPNGLVPYHGSSAWCPPDSLLGKLLNSEEWHIYALNLINLSPLKARKTEIELRYHDEHAGGFYMHSDNLGGGAGGRDLVITLYYNKDWTVEDGGLLQFWRLDEDNLSDTPAYVVQNALQDSMDFYNLSRIKTIPAGFYPYNNELRDFTLVDQVLPAYNRIFFLHSQGEEAYHSVNPSRGKPREGFVQRLLSDED